MKTDEAIELLNIMRKDRQDIEDDILSGDGEPDMDYILDLEKEMEALRMGAMALEEKAELQAYRDTGLEPDEILKIKADIQDGYLKQAARRYGVPVDRLQSLAQADRDGRLVVLGGDDDE